MEKKELIRSLIEAAAAEGARIEYATQFGHAGFIDANDEFWCCDGYTIVAICSKIATACAEDLL